QPASRRQDPVEPADPPPPPDAENNTWQKIRSAAGALKRPLGTYLDNCRLTALDGKEMHLSFPDPYTLGLVEKEENFAALKAAVAEVCGQPDIKIKLELASSAPAAAEPEQPTSKGSGKKGSASEEEILKDALDVFGGIVIR
ncbi:MAG: hypothetical protein IH923_10075, partial [Nitrospinae bacterium]|nr:hypothetical protein [Nitrospinota bacterium]